MPAAVAPLPTVSEIGTNFMTNYIFPFEYVSLVLLVAMIGAAILIREQKLGDTPAAATPSEQSEEAADPDVATQEEGH